MFTLTNYYVYSDKLLKMESQKKPLPDKATPSEETAQVSITDITKQCFT